MQTRAVLQNLRVSEEAKLKVVGGIPTESEVQGSDEFLVPASNRARWIESVAGELTIPESEPSPVPAVTGEKRSCPKKSTLFGLQTCCSKECCNKSKFR